VRFHERIRCSFVIDGCSFDPADHLDGEESSKNGVRGGEERLMLAVLQDAVKCFQEKILLQCPREEKLFQEAEDWFLTM